MTVWRWLWFLVKVGLAALAALWIAARPGHVSFVWLGWRVDTSIGVLIAALILLIVVAVLLHRLWRLVWRGPRDLQRLRSERRRRQGYRALSQGMAAVAAGDAAEAKRQARLANSLLKDPPLVLLLAAQTAQLGGDETAAKRYFTAMLERPETAFLGLRGLLMQALKAGDHAEARALARKAYEQRPNTPWAVATLLDLELEAGNAGAAEALLPQAARLKALPEPASRRKRAVLAAERARTTAPGKPAEALDAGKLAVKLAPELVPARALYAGSLAGAGRLREATKLLEQGWAAAPHPALAAAYAALQPATEEPLARYRRFQRLAEIAPGHRESRLALGECALAAGLAAEARKLLEAAAAAEGAPDRNRPSGRLARLMVKLEESQGDATAARRWLLAAADADPDPAWHCSRCAAVAASWQANCPHCHAFDTLAWAAPARGPAITGPAAAGLLTASPPPPPPRAAGSADPAATLAATAAAATPATATEPPPPPVDAARLVN